MSEIMAKLCPFRKKKCTTKVTGQQDSKAKTFKECEEEFLECYQGSCAMWTESGCVLGRIHTVINQVSHEETAIKETEENDKKDNLIETSVKVLEAKETKTAGTIRAWCQHAESDKKGAVFAKNGNGKTLLESIGKQVQVKYRLMDNGTAFAVFVQAES
ncbi:MAG: hypothetical protein FH756_10700 [Firmicutes bacterium]|nr:hypothetical protein [Bacillota bacterium]